MKPRRLREESHESNRWINKKDLVVLKDLLEAGRIAPIIDKRYPLNEVAEAIRYLEEGHAKGKVVVITGWDQGLLL